MITEYDKDESGSLDFDQFTAIMMKEINLEPEMDPEINEAYRVFDRDDKGITAGELKKVMNKLINLRKDY